MRSLSDRRRRALAPAALLLAATLAAGLALPTRAQPAEPPGFAAGTLLAEALQALAAGGLRLVFSDRLVRPEMRLPSATTTSEPRALLDELLAPHGLAAEEAPGGGLAVVRRSGPPPPATVRGTVRSRPGLAPLPAVAVSLSESGAETRTDGAGRFELTAVEPGTYTLLARRPGFVIERRDGVVAPPAGVAEVELVLQPAPLSSEEIVVHPSRVSLLADEPAAPFALSREQILSLPHLGDDVFRALGLLPGTASNDLTAQIHVRGGRRDEVAVLLDGQELYQAYHLNDFDNGLSVVDASGLASLELTTGAFPSRYGDRMGAILDMSTLEPGPQRHLGLSLSVLRAQAEGSGSLGERTGWLASARRGTTDLAGEVFSIENPVYWDLFGKLDHRPTPRQSLRLHALASGDVLDFRRNDDGELTRYDTDYGTAYLWLTHQAVLSDRLFVDSGLSGSRVERDRRGGEDEEEKIFTVRDERDLEVAGVLQAWHFQASDRHYLRGGFEARRFEATYDYASDRDFLSPLAELRAEPRDGVFDFAGSFSDDYLGIYLSDRWQPAAALTLELGLRHDRHSLTGDRLWSPRVNLAWGPREDTLVRLGWGHYYQSHRAYELLVPDGDTRFYPAERSEDWVLGVERRLAGGPLAALRGELYRRRVRDPRPRYDSLFEPFDPFPEGELDRYRFAPERGVAEGVELFLEGRSGRRFDWWLNYGFATADDVLDGREVPRLIDQRHTLNLDLAFDLGYHWRLNLAWRFHTGRPTTPISLAEGEPDPDGGEPGGEEPPELHPVLGPINSLRLPDYHRLDLRLSRSWRRDRGTLTLFVDVQNVYDRANVAGYDLDLDEDDGELRRIEELWPGIFPSAGVSWTF